MTPRSLEIRLEILDEWAERGLIVRLCPDTQAFNWRGTEGLEDWQREHLREYKTEFAEALRFRAGLCIRCGLDAAKHPDASGRRQKFGPDGLAIVVPTTRPNMTFGPFDATWEEHPAPKGSFPPLWCLSCYERGAWEEFSWGIPMKAGARASSARKSEAVSDDALFAGIEFDATESLF